MKAEPVLAELSVYPLRQAELGPAIEAAVRGLRQAGLEPRVGPASTTVRGDSALIFSALEQAFGAAAEFGDVVMAIRVSNACGRG